jgi:hypothetical protein
LSTASTTASSIPEPRITVTGDDGGVGPRDTAGVDRFSGVGHGQKRCVSPGRRVAVAVFLILAAMVVMYFAALWLVRHF